MDEINQIKEAIAKMDESEAKSLLQLIMISADQSEDEQTIKTVQSIKQSLVETGQMEENHQQVEAVHILFGDAVGGSLKAAIRHTPYANTNSIIVWPENLVVGPVKSLHTKEGINYRYQWLKENFNDYFSEIDEDRENTLMALEKVKSIEPHQQVIIWTSENAAEQAGLRIVLYLLQNKGIEVSELNTYHSFHNFYSSSELEYDEFSPTTGEIAPEELLQLYKQFEFKAINHSKRQALVGEARELLSSESMLRTWNHNGLSHSAEDRDDAFIILCAKRLHQEIGKSDYMLVIRLIGEVLGHKQQYTGDQWIEYRIRALIKKGIFSYRGKLIAMRFYEVKLNEEYA